MAQTEIERSISASLLRLRTHSTFFAALSLFAKFAASESVPTAATDGRTIYYNVPYCEKLPVRQLDGLLLHEVLHAALMHAVRRGTRDCKRWNIAADIVVNGICSKQAFLELPPGGIREPDLEELRVEEIYELIGKQHEHNCSCLVEGGLGGPDAAKRMAELEVYWERALRQAEAVARQQGSLPAGMERLLGGVGVPQVDWRSALWRFLVRTPCDFDGFDRRFLSRGLYLEVLEGESLKAHIAVDTSGSVGPEELSLFMGEIIGILGAYPHIAADLYYADAALYGPFDLKEQIAAPTPKGGGGTSFVPFFERLSEERSGQEAVAIYLTDGYGTFPTEACGIPTLWVVTPGGLPSEDFPFGEVVRLLPSS